ncbi:MAG: GNAT family N-acetyltransferase [Coleofasciculaceae cyanobacterium]
MSQLSPSLPAGCILRRASNQDIWSIRFLVLGAALDPTQLHAEQFWLIESDSKIVACGQLRSFSGAQELGSLVVKKAWRNRGLGTLLTQHLIHEASQPLYLECLGKNLREFYSRLGFVPVSLQEVPPSLKSKFALTQLGKTILRIPVEIMQYQKLLL